VGRAAVFAAAGAAFVAALALTITGVGDRAAALPNWQALILGLVQGATELLPISSSGHLILVPWLGDWEYLKEDDLFNQTFDVSLHLGTLIAVVAYFRHDLAQLLAAFGRTLRTRRIETGEERIAWFVAVATVPAALVGVLGEEVIAERLGEPWQIALLLPFFGGVLWVADRRPQEREMSDLGLREAVAVGLAQCLSLLPGVSRSGVTITAGRFLKLDRDSAARFSFLLLVPITGGAVIYKGVTDVLLGDLPPGMWGPFVVGSLASLASGLIAISALLGYVRRHDYTVFVVYRIIAGAVVLAIIAAGARSAGY
jgi:undecaprenyl-diphosphatase